jgi:hypothetical protein
MTSNVAKEENECLSSVRDHWILQVLQHSCGSMYHIHRKRISVAVDDLFGIVIESRILHRNSQGTVHGAYLPPSSRNIDLVTTHSN